MDFAQWIARLGPSEVTSDELFYEHMESQSYRSLPVIYRPFDLNKRGHWLDRGYIWDFMACVGTGRILDFGPGDGWPSLLMAPFLESVVGIDASRRRLDACSENARRLGIRNFEPVHVPAGSPLPFPDGSFDGVVAASSIEQTPNPLGTLKELHRVLKPGGRLRVLYESLREYRDGRENDVWMWEPASGATRLVVYDRRIAEERVTHYGLQLGASAAEVSRALSVDSSAVTVELLQGDALERIRPWILQTMRCTLFHPGCATMMTLLQEAGFSRVMPTHSGGRAAVEMYDRITDEGRPKTIEDLDRLLQPVVQVASALEAPPELEPPILAIQ